MPNLDVIEDASEAHPISIKDPGAVTRFQSGGFHASKMTGHPGAEHRGAWQFPWDQVAGWNARLDMTPPLRYGRDRSLGPLWVLPTLG